MRLIVPELLTVKQVFFPLHRSPALTATGSRLDTILLRSCKLNDEDGRRLQRRLRAACLYVLMARSGRQIASRYSCFGALGN